MITIKIESNSIFRISVLMIMSFLRSFKNQNEVTVVQAFKMELGGHCGCVFRHIPVLLRTGIF